MPDDTPFLPFAHPFDSYEWQRPLPRLLGEIDEPYRWYSGRKAELIPKGSHWHGDPAVWHGPLTTDPHFGKCAAPGGGEGNVGVQVGPDSVQPLLGGAGVLVGPAADYPQLGGAGVLVGAAALVGSAPGGGGGSLQLGGAGVVVGAAAVVPFLGNVGVVVAAEALVGSAPGGGGGSLQPGGVGVVVGPQAVEVLPGNAGVVVAAEATIPQEEEDVTGMVVWWPAAAIPSGWLPLEGQTLTTADFPALAAVIGNGAGGPPGTFFTLPDSRGRGLWGAGTGPGPAAYVVGQVLGTQQETLTAAQLAAHTHAQGGQTLVAGGVGVQGGSGWTPSGQFTQANSGGAPHPNMPPVVVGRWIIKM